MGISVGLLSCNPTGYARQLLYVPNRRLSSNPLDILEPTPTTLDLQASTHNPLDPQTLDPRPTTPSTHNNKRIFLFIPLYGRSINQIFLLQVFYIWTLQVPKLFGSPHDPGTSSHPYGTHCRQLN